MNVTATGVNVVCPVCLKQHIFALVPGYSSLSCPKKGKAFDVLYAKTRAKNQHAGPRNSGIKVYQIRLILPNKTENLVEFRSKAARFEYGPEIVRLSLTTRESQKLYRTARYTNLWSQQTAVL